METRTFKIDNYITVPGFAIVELGLSGNELLCYSLIYGFTQDKETEFRGSLNYVASALNVTKQNAKKIIDRLIDRGLIEKREMFFSGVKFCHYVANRYGVAEIATGRVQNNNGGVAEIATGGVAKTATNIDNKDNSIDKIEDTADGGLFPTEPVKEQESKQRGTTETLCLFVNSKFNRYEDFAACFATKPEFANVDIAYYYNAVADWSAQKGKKMKDWIATARNFMRSDIEKKKLHTIEQAGAGFDFESAKRYLEMGMD
jgi:predicted transcriptional regulator